MMPGRGMVLGPPQGAYMGMPNVGAQLPLPQQQQQQQQQQQAQQQHPVSVLHQSFKNPNWPPNFITPENVLDYFCDPGNVFYDVSSCNQHIRMQNLNRPLHECLLSMQGIQYTIVGAFPPLYVILKQRRNSPTNVTPLAYYYIVNGTVYQCPDVYTYVQSKLIGIVDPLRQALEQARQFSRFNVAKGYYWEFKDSEAGSVADETKEVEKPQTARSTFYQRARTDAILRELFEKYPPPDGIEFNFGNESETTAEGSSSAPTLSSNETRATTATSQQHEMETGQSSETQQGVKLASPSRVPVLQPSQLPESMSSSNALFRGKQSKPS